MEIGYIKAQSDNLPMIDSFMVAEFFNNANYSSAEMRGDKTKRSARESYGDDAIGYVQVKRDGDICNVKATITPEHKIRTKGYSCILKCDERNETILSVECEDCAVQKGGCKHSIAFLMWMHRRSEEASPTEVKCYWSKPKLPKVGTTLKFIKAKEIGNINAGIPASSSIKSNQHSFLKGVKNVLKNNSGESQIQVTRYVEKKRPSASRTRP